MMGLIPVDYNRRSASSGQDDGVFRALYGSTYVHVVDEASVGVLGFGTVRGYDINRW